MSAMTDKLADAVAALAQELPDHPSSREVLVLLAKVYRRGWNDALNQSAAELAVSLGKAAREKVT